MKPLRRSATFLAVSALGLFGSTLSVTPALATPNGTEWGVFPAVFPTNLAPGGKGEIIVDLLNVGATPSSGPITVTDTLPPGVTATDAGGVFGARLLSVTEEVGIFGGARWECAGNGAGERELTGATVVTCVSNPEFLPRLPLGPPAPEPEERVAILVEAGARSSGSNHVTVSGGGATSATSASNPVVVDPSAPGFGFSGSDVLFSDADGTPDWQAGSHPYEMTVFLGFNERADKVNNTRMSGGEVRNLEVNLPPGIFGDTRAVPRCTRSQLDGQSCPIQSLVGLDSPSKFGREAPIGPAGWIPVGVFNMVPPKGTPVELAFSVAGIHAFLDAGVRNGHGYGIVEHIHNVPQTELDQNILTLWGVPAEASHDFQRSPFGVCNSEEENCTSGLTPKPFLTLPTSCEGPQLFGFRGTGSWQDPSVSAEASVTTHDQEGTPQGFTGCEKLSMSPSISVSPEVSFADSPTGLSVELKMPQEALEAPNGLVSSTLKNVTVTLPEGVVVNPARAAGLAACSDAQADLEGEGPVSCPANSKVGTVRVKSPLLQIDKEPELEGPVYVLNGNPPNLRLLFTLSGDGLNLKLLGSVQLDEATGRLTTTFTEAPELPFSDFKASFEGGPLAAIATPTNCGTYATTTELTPWATPLGESLFPASAFAITAGPQGSACPSSPLAFAPSFQAESVSDQAGSLTPYSVLLRRDDAQQRIASLQLKLPEGVGALIGSVPLCPESQASAGTCPEASQIGHAIVQAGAGATPLTIPQPGQPPVRVFLTGPYDGRGACSAGAPGCSPYGLSIVTPVIAGPFNLGTNVVRARIDVDPNTAQVSVATDPQGVHSIPTILHGVPTDVRTINTVIDRSAFTLNPTDCAVTGTTGTAFGTQGASASLQSRFQVGGCRGLRFAPKFSAQTQGNGSRRGNGASLTVRLSTAQGPSADPSLPAEANIAKVETALPLALPSRLATLQKACTEAQFNQNPAGCPTAANVGSAIARTPELPVPLQGPAYLVSHGNEAFPDLELVLQGYGVKIVLDGKTQIKNGITYSRFQTVPDAPVTSFQLTLPEGPNSLIVATKSLCRPTRTATVTKRVKRRVHGRLITRTKKVKKQIPEALLMPTTITGQNGAVLKQNTKIAVSGCAVRNAKKKRGASKKGDKARHHAGR